MNESNCFSSLLIEHCDDVSDEEIQRVVGGHQRDHGRGRRGDCLNLLRFRLVDERGEVVECRPLVHLVPPAHVHHGVELLGAVERLFQPLTARFVNGLKDLEKEHDQLVSPIEKTCPQLFHHGVIMARKRSVKTFKAPYLLPRLRRPGLEPVAEHLPERDAVGPDVGGGGELEEVDALWCTPRNGQFQVGVEVGLVVVLADSEGAGEAEVGNLDGLLGEDEDVARGQVAVDYLEQG